MLAARIGLAGALERSEEDEPLADAVLALSGSTAAVIALLDLAAGAVPFTAIPALLILLGHALHRRRVAILAAILVWIGVLGAGGPSGLATMVVMVGLCLALLAGPGRAVEWVEACWDARTERVRRERAFRLAAIAAADGIEAVGWIEELPEEPVDGPR